jgi:cytochrome b
MEDGMTKSYIWPLFNRVSHVLMILFFTACYILGDFDELLSYHAAFGLALGVVILFRILWGFIGPKHSKFKDFNFSLHELKAYLLGVFSKGKKYTGHNPASSYAITAMLLLALLSILTGLLTYGIEENRGILSFLHMGFYSDMEVFEELHELFSNLFLGVILIHIAGSLLDKFIKKNDAIDSMVTGYKTTGQKEDVRTGIFQKAFALLAIATMIFSIYYLVFSKDNMFIAGANVKQDYALLHPQFANECGSCHITYPPYLLPKRSWVTMMGDLENHFGDDASIDEAVNLSILTFLKNNSAENSTHEAAFKILKSLKDNNSTIAVTKIPYWEKKHKKISDDVFKDEKIKSKANCKACHIDIENGLIENDLIKVPI